MAELQDTNIIGSLMLNGSPIIESGDGYIRWADGTQICTGYMQTLYNPSKDGVLYASTYNPNFQFAKVFSASPSIHLYITSNSMNNIIGAIPLGVATPSGYSNQVKVWGSATTGMSYTININYFAIGRWK